MGAAAQTHSYAAPLLSPRYRHPGRALQGSGGHRVLAVIAFHSAPRRCRQHAYAPRAYHLLIADAARPSTRHLCARGDEGKVAQHAATAAREPGSFRFLRGTPPIGSAGAAAATEFG